MSIKVTTDGLYQSPAAGWQQDGRATAAGASVAQRANIYSRHRSRVQAKPPDTSYGPADLMNVISRVCVDRER